MLLSRHGTYQLGARVMTMQANRVRPKAGEPRKVGLDDKMGLPDGARVGG
jgi:hypothetical protein